MKNNLNPLIMGLAWLIGSDLVRSATFTWVNAAGGDGNDTNDWSPQQVRGAAQTLTMQ